MTDMTAYSLHINGHEHRVTAADDTPLLWVLRDRLKLMGTKYACGVGACGACLVHVGGADRVGKRRVFALLA